MAMLKDSIVTGSLRVTDTVLTDGVQASVIKAPTTSGGTTYGVGSNGQVLKSNGTTVYWGTDDNSTSYVASSQGAGNSGKFLTVNSSGQVVCSNFSDLVTTKAAATYNTSTSDQTIAASQYLTGAQTIKAVTTSNIDAANIKYNVTVKVGDANSAGRIKNVTGIFTSTVSSGQTKAAAGQILSGYSAYVDGAEVKGSIATKSSSDLTASGATVSVPAGYYASAASKAIGNGTVVASVSSNSGGSASMAASGFTALSGSNTSSYYVTLSTSAGSVKAKAAGGTAGYVTSSTTNETAATSVAVSGNGNKLYIPAAGVTASISSNSGGSASMAATGFTALTGSTTSSYYVTLSTSAGSVKAKAVGSGTGIVTTSTSNETAATSVSVSGNGTKLYIPTTGVTASVSSNSGGSASIAATGFTALTGSTTSSYYVTLSTSAGSVKAKAVGNGTGIVTSSTSNETGATSVSVSGNGTKLYIPTTGVTASVSSNSGIKQLNKLLCNTQYFCWQR